MRNSKRSILLVEDEALIALAERMTLESVGYDVTIARTGEDALATLTDEYVPDLILMDIDLGPGMDGTETARRILKEHHIPIVFLSSHTEKEYTDLAEQITSYGYIVKNSGDTVLLASIRMAFKLHEANQEVQRSEAELRESQEIALVGRWDYWHQHHRLRWAPMIYRIFELDQTEFQPSYERFLETIHEADREAVDAAWRKSLADRKPYEIEHRLLMKDGRVKWVREYCRTEFDHDGIPINSVGIVQDITDRKAMELTVAGQKQYLEAILATTDDGFWVVTPDKRITSANDAYCRMSGYSADELVTMAINDIDAVEDQQETIDRIGRIMKNGGETFETRHRRKDGSVFDVEVTATRFDREDGICLVCFCRDITDRKHYQQQLSEQHAFFEATLDNMLDFVAVTDMEGNFLYAGRSHEQLGYPASSLIGRNVMEFVHPDDYGHVTEELSAFLQDTRERTVEYRYRQADGSYTWLETSGRLLEHGNRESTRILFNSREVTARKTLENTLANERYRLSSIIEGTDAGTWEWNVQTGVNRVNEKWATIIGYTLDEISPVSVETWQQFVHPEDLQQSNDAFRAHFAGETPMYEIEARMRHKDGHWVWVLDRGKVRTWTEDGKPEWVFGTHLEITERKRAENELHSVSKMQAIMLKMASEFINTSFEHTDVAIKNSLREIGEFVDADRVYIFDYDWTNELCNNTYEWCKEGISPEIENLQNVPTTEVYHWVRAHRGGQEISIEDVLQLHPHDGVRQVLEPQGIKSVLALPMIKQGECVGFVGFDSVNETRTYSENEKALLKVFSQMLVNVEHRKELSEKLVHAKEEAEKNSANVTAIVEGTPDSIWAFDKDYNILYLNSHFRDLVYAAFGILLEEGSNLLSALPETLRSIWKPRYDRVLAGERVSVVDEAGTNKGILFMEVAFNPILQNDQVIGGSCFGRDITSRKQAEDEISKQLSEKETLLREVHHRVKNNIATIEGLLSLQADSVVQAEAKAALQDSIARVQSMRILYDKLLVSKNLGEVSIRNYTEDLIDSLVTFFDPTHTITVETAIADFGIDSKTAVSIGIIVNELLTNVFKYAFKGRDGGMVTVSIEKEEQTMTLTIHDDGIGVDERKTANESPGFGLTVVKMLAEQLGGSYSSVNENGTKSVVQVEI